MPRSPPSGRPSASAALRIGASAIFTQEDPIGLAGGLNLYGYADGDPINFWDPFGLDCRVAATGERCKRPMHPFRQILGAVRDFARNYFDMREANTIGADKYFHAKANCEASQRGSNGESTAEVISDARETVDGHVKRDPADSVIADQAANRAGRAAGRANPSGNCGQLVNSLRPNGLSEKYD